MTSQYPVRVVDAVGAVSGCRNAFHHRVPLDLLCLALLVSRHECGNIDSIESPSSASRADELVVAISVQ